MYTQALAELRANITPRVAFLLVGAAAVTLLLALSRPPPSAGLGVAGRLVFWTAHISIGLCAIAVSSFLVTRLAVRRFSPVTGIFLSALVGTLICAPLYLLLEHAWPPPAVTEIDGWLDQLAARGQSGAYVAEVIEVLPWTLLIWLLLSLPTLQQTIFNSDHHSVNAALQDVDDDGSQASQSAQRAIVGAGNVHQSGPVRHASDEQSGNAPSESFGIAHQQQTGLAEFVEETSTKTSKPDGILQRLPRQSGQDIIAISSDLHYLNVYTANGKSTLLGNLKDVVAELGDRGLQTHRSHWVSHKHVVRIISQQKKHACVMSNGMQIPVSRRNLQTIKQHYGDGIFTTQ